VKKYEVCVWDDRTEWFYEGKRHRDDGPAKEYVNGDKYWFINGLKHRDDGPAVELANGYKEWWLNGKKVTENEVIKKYNLIVIDLTKIEMEIINKLKQTIKLEEIKNFMQAVNIWIEE
jgi:hypothetical protein